MMLLFLVLIIILCILRQDAALMLAQCGLTPCRDRRWLPARLHGHMRTSEESACLQGLQRWHMGSRTCDQGYQPAS